MLLSSLLAISTSGVLPRIGEDWVLISWIFWVNWFFPSIWDASGPDLHVISMELPKP